MKLNIEQQNQLIRKLDLIWRNRTCEICGNGNWNINDTIFQLSEFQGDNIVLGGGSVAPLISMACNNCGNTKLLNAIQLGFIDPKNPNEIKSNLDK